VERNRSFNLPNGKVPIGAKPKVVTGSVFNVSGSTPMIFHNASNNAIPNTTYPLVIRGGTGYISTGTSGSSTGSHEYAPANLYADLSTADQVSILIKY